MIKLTLARAVHDCAPLGTITWVNPDTIEVVFPVGGGSLIWMSGGWDMVVEETPEAIASLIEDAAYAAALRRW